MARVRQRGTEAERSVATVLRDLRLAYRLNVRSLPGSPDFANRADGRSLFTAASGTNTVDVRVQLSPNGTEISGRRNSEPIGAVTRVLFVTFANKGYASCWFGSVRPLMRISFLQAIKAP
jgi:DNA mismatch endonuclease Vsr